MPSKEEEEEYFLHQVYLDCYYRRTMAALKLADFLSYPKDLRMYPDQQAEKKRLAVLRDTYRQRQEELGQAAMALSDAREQLIRSR